MTVASLRRCCRCVRAEPSKSENSPIWPASSAAASHAGRSRHKTRPIGNVGTPLPPLHRCSASRRPEPPASSLSVKRRQARCGFGATAVPFRVGIETGMPCCRRCVSGARDSMARIRSYAHRTFAVAFLSHWCVLDGRNEIPIGRAIVRQCARSKPGGSLGGAGRTHRAAVRLGRDIAENFRFAIIRPINSRSEKKPALAAPARGVAIQQEGWTAMERSACSMRPVPRSRAYFKSKRSRFITLVQAATKSCTNFSCESLCA